MNTNTLIIKVKAIIVNMLYSMGSTTGKLGSFTIHNNKINVAIINVIIVMTMAIIAIIVADVELKDLRIFKILI